MEKITKLENILPNLAKARTRGTKQIQYFNNLFTLTKEQKILGKNKSFFVRTYGCQANERDSEVIKGILTAMGFVQSKD